MTALDATQARARQWKYSKESMGIQRLLSERERLGNTRVITAATQSHGSLLRRLVPEAVLTGHTGCVNHLRWNRNGSLLASGSDDTNLILWDYATKQQRHVIETGHLLNIFAVCFVPETNDHILATGAMDKDVRIHYAPFRPEATKRFRLHKGRVKDIASSPGAPKLFWSVAEDGLVYQFDVRALPRSDGTADNDDPSGVLIRLGKGRNGGTLRGMAMAVHPLDPTKVVLACGDFYTRMYDRRMLRVQEYRSRRVNSEDAQHSTPPEATTPVEVFAPPHLHLDGACDAVTRRRHNEAHGTSIQFSSDGTEILANYHNDHIYLFNVKHSRFAPVAVFDKSGSPQKQVDLPVWQNGRYMDGSTMLRADLNALHSKGLVALLGKHYTRALDHFQTACHSSKLPQMSQSYRKDLYHNTAKAYLGRKWRADDYLACVFAKLALSLDPDDREIELTYVKALHAGRRSRHVIARAQKYQSRFPDHEDDVEQMLKEALSRQSPQSERQLRVFRRRMDSSDEDSDDEYNGDSSDDDDSSFDIQEEPVPSDTEETPLLSGSLDSDDDFWTSPTRDGMKVNCDAVRRYIGYCNLQTDIKEATFFGPNDAYIVAGSDDGRAYIWDKHTGRLLNSIEADADIVNCVQPHPVDTCLATSGIENVIRLWTPTGDDDTAPSDDELEAMVMENQVNMAETSNYYLSGASSNVIRLIFQSGEAEGMQECATS
ncbi:hypothetical protein Poli38472_009592 [Pythium oligandrum]|uniref:WD40 repeat-like protein n=1 Tax=Pythium oligandrum TaxID=41045 RepID=A0A8K1FIH9_PYTOL|nr:hypothetical protein Poli38472_009592 [Pythium oligandrum]|eukprot:TMW62099.1 hypothetical protein Poli38472_009592 [Pythium oligandrum]